MPVLWANGKHEEIFQYVKQDVRTTLSLAKLSETRGRLDWLTHSGKSRCLLIPKGWFTVKQAKKLPEPARVWYFSQWDRNKFTDWMD